MHARKDDPAIFQLLDSHSCLPPSMDLPGNYGCALHPMFVNRIPYRDFIHFTLNLKPWLHGKDQTTEVVSTATTDASTTAAESFDLRLIQSSVDYWHHILLHELYDQLHLTQNDMDDLFFLGDPPLGQYPKMTDMIRAGRQYLRQHGGGGGRDGEGMSKHEQRDPQQERPRRTRLPRGKRPE